MNETEIQDLMIEAKDEQKNNDFDDYRTAVAQNAVSQSQSAVTLDPTWISSSKIMYQYKHSKAFEGTDEEAAFFGYEYTTNANLPYSDINIPWIGSPFNQWMADLMDFEDASPAVQTAMTYLRHKYDEIGPIGSGINKIAADANNDNPGQFVSPLEWAGQYHNKKTLGDASKAFMRMVAADHIVDNLDEKGLAEITTGTNALVQGVTDQLGIDYYDSRPWLEEQNIAAAERREAVRALPGNALKFLTGVFQGVVGGVRDAGQGVIDLGHDLEQSLPEGVQGPKLVWGRGEGLELIWPDDPDYADLTVTLPDVPHGGGAQEALRGITQFMAVFGTAGGLIKLRGALRVGRDVWAGATADATFDPELGNVSTLLRELDVNNAVTRFLDSKVGEDALPEERLRARLVSAALEGAILGLMIEPLMRTFVHIKRNGLQGTVKKLMDKGKEIAVDMIPPPGQLNMGIGPSGRRIATGDRVGQYVGAPEGIDTPQAVSALSRRIGNAVKEGEGGRYWYERSGETLLKVAGNDPVEAEKIAQLIGIFSSGTPVGDNMHYALQAYYQHQAGMPILAGRFPKAMAKKATDVLNGIPWSGRKTNTFYINLMRVIDPSRDQGVTVDVWMMRAFGYTAEKPGPAQYDFVERQVLRLTNNLNKKLGPGAPPWEPQQVQAAIWVSTKANWPVKGFPEGIGLDAAKFDYADAMDAMTSQISWESIPGATSKHLPEMFDAPMAQQVEYHVAISKAFLDDKGHDLVAKRLGLLSPGDFEAPGFFEGKVSPGTQTEVLAPRQYKGPKWGKVDRSVESLINQYTAIRGILLKQDGVGWHRPFLNSTKKAQDGAQINIGRLFTDEETKALGDELAKLSGHGDYNPISTHGGVRLLHFDWLKGDVPQFQALVVQAFDNVRAKGFFKDVAKQDTTLEGFAVQSGYQSSKWTDNADGISYLENSFKGQPDIQREIRDIVKELLPRIDDIDADFAARYGWTVNDTILKGWRVASETGNPLAIGQQSPSRYSMGRSLSGDEYLDRSPADIGLMPPDERVELLVESIGAVSKGAVPARWKDKKELARALLDDAQQSNWTKSDPGKAGPLADRFYGALIDVVGSKDPDFGDKALQSKVLNWFKRTQDLDLTWDDLKEEDTWVALVHLAAEQIQRTTH